jgi:hypothetical protein
MLMETLGSPCMISRILRVEATTKSQLIVGTPPANGDVATIEHRYIEVCCLLGRVLGYRDRSTNRA